MSTKHFDSFHICLSTYFHAVLPKIILQYPEHIKCLLCFRESALSLLHNKRQTSGFEKRKSISDAELGEGRMKERFRLIVMREKLLFIILGVRDVTASPAGYLKFCAKVRILFEQKHALATLRHPSGSHHA